MLSKNLKLIISFSFLITLLISCSNTTDPSENVMSYLKALTGDDTATVAALSCADWEEQAKLEADSFLSVEAELEDVVCEADKIDGDLADVSCSGLIQMTYDDEVRSINLSLRTYSMKKDLGEWLVCGYK